jgi:hypothetical protein
VTATTRTVPSPIGAAQQLLGQSCLNCHSQVHGSNHPWRAGSGYANAAYGTMAQAPDNQFQALSLSRVIALGEHTTLSATASSGRLQQDELLLPFSLVFVAAAPLPSDRLQGSIKTYNGAVIPAQATPAFWPATVPTLSAHSPAPRCSKTIRGCGAFTSLIAIAPNGRAAGRSRWAPRGR